MDKLTISMPEQMKDYVKGRINSGQYGNISEFIRDLIRKEQNQESAVQELRDLIERAEASGISSRTEDDIFAAAVAEVKAKGLLRD